MYETILMDIYPDWITGGGIFLDLQSFDVPWKDLNINADLDLAYYGNCSGGKSCSALVDRLRGTDNILSETARANIARVIWTVCGENWKKLYDTLSIEYNPIENVDAYLTETTDTTGNRDTNDTIKSTGTDTHAAGGTDTTFNTGSITTEASTDTKGTVKTDIAGFNSDNYSDANNESSTETVTASNTETRNTKEDIQYGRTDTETKDLTDNHTGTEATTGKVEHTLHRHGNIGVTTNQQMIESERELWNWYFYDVVFRDIDKYLTSSVY